jgi:EmrB/QacA subfamily drug resistance transporter
MGRMWDRVLVSSPSDPAMTPGGPRTLRYRSAAGRWVIAATVLGSGMAAIDATVIGIALPTIGRAFHAPLTTLQWVVTGYTLTLSSLLLLGGSLGDRYGRRRIFMIGVAWFAVASAACAVSTGSGQLIATRILQGIGGALLTPGSLAILEASFTPDDDNEAIGAWSGLGGVATAAGPLLGGYLIAVASWRWIFLINVPLGALVLVLSARHVPETRDPSMTGRIDFVGAVLATGSLAALAYALIEGPTRGWGSSPVAVTLVVGVVGAVAFGVVEHRSASPMLPLGLFRNRQLAVTNAVTFVVYAGLGGVLFLLPVVLQVVGGYSPLESGIALLPLTLIMLLLSARSGRLATVIGPRLQMSVGPVVVGLGLILLVRVPDTRSYIVGVLPAVVVIALGLAATVAPLTATALSSAPPDRTGLASAVNNDVARIGSLVAVAVLPAVGGISGLSYLHPHALAHGFQKAVIVAGLLCIIGGGLAAVGITNRRPAGSDAGLPEALSHCALDGTPLVERVETGAGRPSTRGGGGDGTLSSDG